MVNVVKLQVFVVVLVSCCDFGVLRFVEISSSITNANLTCAELREKSNASLYQDELNSEDSEITFLYQHFSGTGAHNFNASVTLGFLGAYGHTPVDLGALTLAIANVNDDPHLLPGRTLQYLAADIGTNPKRSESSYAALAIRVMTVMRDIGTVAFIGPDDTCQSEALVAAAWNLPIISYKCADTRVSDKRIYDTFSRTLPPSSKVAKSVVALLRAFNWTKFVIVAGQRPAWGIEVQEAIKELAAIHGLLITSVHEFSKTDKDYIPTYRDEMFNIIDSTFDKTRVYVFVGEHIALVDFVFCLQARKLLDDGNYMVISVDDEIYNPKRRLSIITRSYLDPHLKEYNETRLNEAFRSVLKLSPSYPNAPNYKELCDKIRSYAAKPPFCVPYHNKLFETIFVPIDAANLYDAVMIYATALTETLNNNQDPRNGRGVLEKIRNRSYSSIQGYEVLIDNNGDAEGNYSVIALLDDKETGNMSMQPVGYFQYKGNTSAGPLDTQIPEFRYFDGGRPIQWVGGRQPIAEPRCGFHQEKCVYKPDWRLGVSLSVAAALVLVAGVFAFKHYRYEHKLACLLWKIDMREIIIIPTESLEPSVKNKNMIQVCRHSNSIMPEFTAKRAYTKIGMYKGNIVAIKPIYKKSIDITRSIRKELKQIREVRHENIIPFIGASVDHGNLCLVTSYCARGSLEDVLANQDLHLDNMFVSSLVSDVVKGMIYLHDSDIVSHGNLRSSNCLVDSRWVLQITDFGLHEFKGNQDVPDGETRELRRQLWRAPELLRDPNSPPRGSQKGDIYSFAIVLYEIVGRKGPWGEIGLTDAEIVARVRDSGEHLRPATDQLGVADYVLNCIKDCWDEDPEQRPDIRFVRLKLKEMQAGLKPNIFDNMLAIMEKYAYNLEGLVQERTNQLTEEKKKTDALLNRMLPKTVAEALKRGDPVEAESFDCVTIYFSDIVGFTELSAVSTPLQVVDLLNDLYTCCDSIISHYDVYKVETIGDAYMVVSGLPVRNGDRHAGEIASMALHLLTKIKRYELRHSSGELLRLRIGIHSGHCVAGVVGLKMPRYCLFGDTVNTASRMESSGESFRIHISEATWQLLEKLGGYHCHHRGLTQIKGKGDMQTYWLVGEDPARRLARIREEILTSSFESLGSDRVCCRDTPDLLRGPTGTESRSDDDLLVHSPINSCFLRQLHHRARLASKTDIYEVTRDMAPIGGRPCHKSQDMVMMSAGRCASVCRCTLSSYQRRPHNPNCRNCHRSAPVVTFCDTNPVLEPERVRPARRSIQP